MVTQIPNGLGDIVAAYARRAIRGQASHPSLHSWGSRLTWVLPRIRWVDQLPGLREFSTRLRQQGFSGAAISSLARIRCIFSWRPGIECLPTAITSGRNRFRT